MTALDDALAALAASTTASQAVASAAIAAEGAQSRTATAAAEAAVRLQALTSRVEGARLALAAQAEQVTAGRNAREAIVAQIDAARNDGDAPPLANAQANALRDALAGRIGVAPAGNMTSVVRPAVADLDAAVEAPVQTARTALQAARTTFATRQDELAAAEGAAQAARDAAEAAAPTLAASLAAALARFDLATVGSAAALPRARHLAATLNWVDYQELRASLVAAAGDASGTGVQTVWDTAAAAVVDAVAAAATAEQAVIEAELALATAEAQALAARATRSVAAVAAIEAAITPPGP